MAYEAYPTRCYGVVGKFFTKYRNLFYIAAAFMGLALATFVVFQFFPVILAAIGLAAAVKLGSIAMPILTLVLTGVGALFLMAGIKSYVGSDNKIHKLGEKMKDSLRIFWQKFRSFITTPKNLFYIAMAFMGLALATFLIVQFFPVILAAIGLAAVVKLGSVAIPIVTLVLAGVGILFFIAGLVGRRMRRELVKEDEEEDENVLAEPSCLSSFTKLARVMGCGRENNGMQQQEQVPLNSSSPSPSYFNISFWCHNGHPHNGHGQGLSEVRVAHPTQFF